MKTLTIKQPWASLIIDEYKKYEFRSWKINFRGKILIHAGIGVDNDMMRLLNNYNLEYVKGAIIGEATITDCILVDDNFNDKLYKLNPLVYKKNNYVGKYAWKLENIIKYKEPIYCKGKLGLWNYETDK